MNITDLFRQYLTVSEKLQIPGFGTFLLENMHAKVDSETKKILPPSKKVLFQADYLLQDQSSLKAIAEAQKTSLEAVQAEASKQTEYWKQKLASGEEFEIGGLGKFIFGEGPQFQGERIMTTNPDYYGLDEIKLSEIKSGQNTASNVGDYEPSATDYKTKKSAFWLLLLMIPVVALAYFAVTEKEMLFGKKSFNQETVKDSPIVLPEPKIIDSTAIKLADSLKQDSITKAAAVPVKKSYAGKKNYTANKYRKYPKKKWKQPRKQANR